MDSLAMQFHLDLSVPSDVFDILPPCLWTLEERTERAELVQCHAHLNHRWWAIRKGRPVDEFARLMSQLDARNERLANVTMFGGKSKPRTSREYIPAPPLSDKHLVYFSLMRTNSMISAHPSYIYAEAAEIVTHILLSQDKIVFKDIARRFFIAGTSSVRSARTVALLFHTVLEDIAGRVWHYPHELKRELEALVLDAFHFCWSVLELDQFQTKTGIKRSRDSIQQKALEQIMTLTAFASDLVALDILPLEFFQSVVSYFMANLTSLLHCRALCLMFTRCKVHILPTFGVWFLESCRENILCAYSADGCTNMLTRFYREMVYAIDALLEREEILAYDRLVSEPQRAHHRWAEDLNYDSILDKLIDDVGPIEKTIFSSIICDDFTTFSV